MRPKGKRRVLRNRLETTGKGACQVPNDQDSKQLALAAARAIDDKKGSDIVIQYVGDLLSMTDWFVIATAANKRRADAIADEVAEQLR